MTDLSLVLTLGLESDHVGAGSDSAQSLEDDNVALAPPLNRALALGSSQSLEVDHMCLEGNHVFHGWSRLHVPLFGTQELL